ncbi:tRNA glutamyl-Q(34) synthetase GluQRS [Falsarthrobacter nasiphocae]|uniref:Glutamyl-tRNA synthetase n=1 Tax=Falsarthrobacter nasiphocae TaxID=189863 RepID=A0AAE3YH07_9MICC|nr:tRNA glutamyl-Q(34) synthetase GluQRS [Falsarthrobacter nasiphocae]MDR6891836.1 glutamyl-tRNA synthetase [Falsarthrobacter nasiphocae]
MNPSPREPLSRSDFPGPAGRFAPSPTGDFHLGNLRTAALAWLFARSTGRAFYLRVEDLDRVRAGSEASQLADLATAGITFDGPVLRQSEHTPRYAEALHTLESQGLTYECFCSRREIAEAVAQAASAPNGGPGTDSVRLYPGTCRDLSDDELARKRAESSREPAIRLRAGVSEYAVEDLLAGLHVSPVDDFVLRRNDGAFAYNLVSVVDDDFMSVDQVVRGDDLLDSAGRQAYLASLLGFQAPVYAHVPLALNAEGRRLAKRDGPVTLAEVPNAMRVILGSLGLGPTLEDALRQFDPARLPREPWVVRPQ